MVIDLAKLLIVPFLVYVLKVLITNAANRFCVVSALVVDLNHRIRQTLFAIYRLKKWQLSLPECKTDSCSPKSIYLDIFSETHQIYTNLQSQMVTVLWGKEILLVRRVYRSLEGVEMLVGESRRLFLKWVEGEWEKDQEPSAVWCSTVHGKDYVNAAIESNIEKMEELMISVMGQGEFEKGVGQCGVGYEGYKISVHGSIWDFVQTLFLSKLTAYGTQLFLPLVSVFGIMAAIWVFPEWLGHWVFWTFMAAIFVGLACLFIFTHTKNICPREHS